MSSVNHPPPPPPQPPYRKESVSAEDDEFAYGGWRSNKRPFLNRPFLMYVNPSTTSAAAAGLLLNIAWFRAEREIRKTPRFSNSSQDIPQGGRKENAKKGEIINIYDEIRRGIRTNLILNCFLSHRHLRRRRCVVSAASDFPLLCTSVRSKSSGEIIAMKTMPTPPPCSPLICPLKQMPIPKQISRSLGT